MAYIKKKSERKFKITVCNGYKVNGQKRMKAQTITVPSSVPKRGIQQYVMAGQRPSVLRKNSSMALKKVTRPILNSTRKTGSSGRNRSLRLPPTQAIREISTLFTL